MDRAKPRSGAACLLLATAFCLRASPVRATATLIEKGYELIRAGKPEEAALLFKRAAADDPADAMAHRAYQVVMANLGRFQQVQDEYRAYAHAHPDSGLATYLSFSFADDDEGARRDIEDALKARPADPWLLSAERLVAAMKDINEGRPRRVIEGSSEAASPLTTYDDRIYRAWALSELGRYEEEDREIRRNIEEMPFDPMNYGLLAKRFCETAYYDKCLDAAQKAFELRDSITNRFLKALALKMTGRVKEAESENARMLAMPAVVSGDYLALAWLYSARGDAAKALEYAKKAGERSNDLSTSADIALFEQGSLGAERARQDIDAVLKRNPHSMDALLASAALHTSEGCHCRKSIEECDEVLSVNPRSVQALLGKAAAAIWLDDADEAREAAQAARELAPKDWETLLFVAAAEQKYGDDRAAAKAIRKSIAINPAAPSASVMLGESYLLQGRSSDALKSFARARDLGANSERDIAPAVADARATRFRRFLRRGAPRPRPLDVSHAPSEIREFVRVGTAQNAPWQAIEAAAEPVAALGSTAAPWLKRIVLADTKELNLQARIKAANLLTALSRWGDLVDTLSEPGSSAPTAVQSAFLSAHYGAQSEEARKFLPAVSQIASGSKNPDSRSAAMTVLAYTHDRHYVPDCLSGLSFSVWPARTEADAAPRLTAEMKDSLRRFQTVCPDDGGWTVHQSAINCLGVLEDPSAIPALLQTAGRSSKHFERKLALSALSKIAKRNFGKTSEEPSKTAEECDARAETMWDVAVGTSAPSVKADALAAAARAVEEISDKESAERPDHAVLDAWRAWWRTQQGAIPASYDDEMIARLRRTGDMEELVLYSSGRVSFRTPSGRALLGFDDIDDLESYLKSAGENALPSLAPEQRQEAVRWALTQAIPELRKRGGDKR